MQHNRADRSTCAIGIGIGDPPFKAAVGCRWATGGIATGGPKGHRTQRALIQRQRCGTAELEHTGVGVVAAGDAAGRVHTEGVAAAQATTDPHRRSAELRVVGIGDAEISCEHGCRSRLDVDRCCTRRTG